ncbi:phospholipase A2 inhibitor and Ly6/PLAUR domain-containing protein-like [Cheilinus undulatus]|uniref:phospholipase A2 inhibitor and Ly6/PLAUR domain-containing protein-like n=1 Tax=Cheilinus undulatus TaxID=241271 RepID=UPI001BD39F05|nr:phospholipase A2 inhibitor and Ly6/PLAUR domain-containing protein-like [Cheilinus undulatus]
MMKLTLSAALVWTILSSVEALRCLQTLNGETKTKSCSSSAELCATVAVYNGSPPQKSMERSCVPPSLCEAQNQIISSTYYGRTVAAAVRCCNTDDCNNEDITYPDVTPNGLQCIRCDTPTCNEMENCTGAQDHCYNNTFTVGNVPQTVFGCGSANMCEYNSEWDGQSWYGFFYTSTRGTNCLKAVPRSSALTARLTWFLFLLAPFTLSVN